MRTICRPVLVLPVLVALTAGLAAQPAPAAPQRPAQTGQVQRPEASRQALEGLANVRFQADVRVFSTMAALNLAGFDFESAGHEKSPARQALRQALTGVSPDIRARLQAFYAEHRRNRSDIDQLASYLSLALLLGNAPDFVLAVEKRNVPEDVVPILGFEELVAELYVKGNLGALWPRYYAVYEAELASYRPVLVELIRDTLSYFKIPPRIVMDRQIVLIPDLLGPKNIVNARNVGTSYHVILGPVDKPGDNKIQLQHEYLHFLLDPLIEKYGSLLHRYENLLNLAQNQPNIKPEYQNSFMMVVTESLVEALILRLNRPPETEKIDPALVSLYRRGLIFAPFFYRAFPLYEKSDMSTFPSYIEPLFQQVDEGKIREDEKWAAGIEERLRAATAGQRQEAAAQEESARKRAAQRELLLDAEKLMRGGQLQPAREKLEELLKQNDSDAHAYFYLAQISSQEKAFDKAFELYGRAAGLPTASPSIRAWSKVRMGAYLASREQYAEARRHFDEVAAMSGELDGAKERAVELAKQLP
nr:MAG: hypothetical protein EHM61_20195 [Acidobacteriota bacterium]